MFSNYVYIITILTKYILSICLYNFNDFSTTPIHKITQFLPSTFVFM